MTTQNRPEQVYKMNCMNIYLIIYLHTCKVAQFYYSGCYTINIIIKEKKRKETTENKHTGPATPCNINLAERHSFSSLFLKHGATLILVETVFPRMHTSQFHQVALLDGCGLEHVWLCLIVQAGQKSQKRDDFQIKGGE